MAFPQLILALAATFAAASGGGTIHQDFLEQLVLTSSFRLGKPAQHVVTGAGRSVLFLRSSPRSFVHDLYEYDCDKRQERLLLTAESILKGAEENLSADELARRERSRRMERGIASFSVSADGSRILVPLSERLFVIERKSGSVKELRGTAGFPLDPRFSPDGRYVTCVRDGDLRVIEVESGVERRLTDTASDVITNGLAEFVAQEEMDRDEGYWWSPDSRFIACQQTDVTGLETMHILDPAHPNEEPAAWPYPRTGRKNAVVTLAIRSLDGGAPVWVEWDRNTYPYLVSVVWDANAPLTLVVHNRRQTEALVLAVNETTGKTKLLHRERDSAWVQYDPSVPRWLGDGSAFLWSTERHGSWQLELRARDGGRLRVLHPPALRYRKLVGLDEESGNAWVQAWTDPTEMHLFRVPLSGKGPYQQVSSEPGAHTGVFSDDGRTYVDAVQPRDGAPRQVVMRASGERVGELAVKAEEPLLTANVEYVRLDPPHEFRAAVIRPHGFKAGTAYPVLVHVYGGPFSQMVEAQALDHVFDQWFAENGFVVVKIDGRGTPGRGRTWERAIKGNLIATTLDDQVAALRQLAARYPEIDLGRVAIYGASFGGYFSAMAVMRRPDVFRVGVAVAPVVDWLDYDTYYTERYMGLPDENPDGYRDANVLTHAGSLERPLMIVHGTADDNVYFMHSMKLVDALFHAGRDYEFVPLTDLTHRLSDVTSRQRLYERVVRFVERGLGDGPEPSP
jgi:dipeptidyl-peptidase-4